MQLGPTSCDPSAPDVVDGIMEGVEWIKEVYLEL